MNAPCNSQEINIQVVSFLNKRSDDLLKMTTKGAILRTAYLRKKVGQFVRRHFFLLWFCYYLFGVVLP